MVEARLRVIGEVLVLILGGFRLVALAEMTVEGVCSSYVIRVVVERILNLAQIIRW